VPVEPPIETATLVLDRTEALAVAKVLGGNFSKPGRDTFAVWSLLDDKLKAAGVPKSERRDPP
jgi:hypothetical protein